MLNLKFRGGPSADPLAEFACFREQYGIGGGRPAYSLLSTQGQATSQRYLLELAADQGGWAGTIGQADLPQRLPVRVTGLNDKWTAAKVDLDKGEWFPLGSLAGHRLHNRGHQAARQKLYLGNLVSADDADVWLTLLPSNADGKTCVEVHNPTETDRLVTVNVPVATFLAGKQEAQIRVPKMNSVWVELKR